MRIFEFFASPPSIQCGAVDSDLKSGDPPSRGACHVQYDVARPSGGIALELEVRTVAPCVSLRSPYSNMISDKPNPEGQSTTLVK
jgi:hypothetical protein